MLKRFIQKLFRLRTDVTLNFYIANFFFKHFLRQGTDVAWAVHYTSVVHFPQRITRGKNVYPGDSPGNFIDATNGIIIGDNTNIGPNVGLISTNHLPTNNALFTQNPPIQIGANCWIGMGAIILPGVQLGNFTTVGAGAVVTQSFAEGYCIIAGNPAKVIKLLIKEECIAKSI